MATHNFGDNIVIEETDAGEYRIAHTPSGQTAILGPDGLETLAHHTDELSVGTESAVSSYGDGVEVADGALTSPDLALNAQSTPSWHEGHQVSVAAHSAHTVFDIAAPTELLGGSLHGIVVGGRLTIDGTVVFDRTTFTNTETTDGATLAVFALPPARAETSMKLELLNTGNDPHTFGYRVVTR